MANGKISLQLLVLGPDHVQVEYEAGRLLAGGKGLEPLELLGGYEILEGEIVGLGRDSRPLHTAPKRAALSRAARCLYSIALALGLQVPKGAT